MSAWLSVASAVLVGVLLALEVHAVLRQWRRRPHGPGQLPPVRNPPPMPCVPKPAPWPPPPTEPPPTGKRVRELEQLARNLIDPDVYGHAVPLEIRREALRALGLSTAKSK